MKKLFLLSTLTLLAGGQIFASEENDKGSNGKTVCPVNKDKGSNGKTVCTDITDNPSNEETSFFKSYTRNYATGKKDQFSNAWENSKYITLASLATSHTIGLPLQLGYDASSALKKSDKNVILKGAGILALLLFAVEVQFEILRRLYNLTNFEFGKEYIESPAHTQVINFGKNLKVKFVD